MMIDQPTSLLFGSFATHADGRITLDPRTRTVAQLSDIIAARRYRFTDEDTLQRGIAIALEAAGVRFEREMVLSPGERIDFLVDGGIGIEVKLAYPRNALLRQLQRYAQIEAVSQLLVVTTRSNLSRLPTPLSGKPVSCLVLTGSAL